MLSEKLAEEHGHTAGLPSPSPLHIDALDRAPVLRPSRPFAPLTDAELADWLDHYQRIADSVRMPDGTVLDVRGSEMVKQELRSMRREMALRREAKEQSCLKNP